MSFIRICALTGIGLLCLTAILSADTLTLRDGRRVEGELIAVQNGFIDFEGFRGSLRERLRFNRADVVRIELESFERDNVRDSRDSRDSRDARDSGRPAGLREKEIAVDSRQAWNDAGIEVRAGQTIYFVAQGRVRWGPGREDGPEGEHGSPHNAARPIPSRPAASL